MPEAEIKQLLAFDVGMVRTGIARASMIAAIAQPVITLQTDDVMARFAEICKQYEADIVVFGLPRSMEGKETIQTQWVRSWVANIKKYALIPMFWQDEAGTTLEAEAHGGGNPAGIDAQAAAVILQDFINTPAANRVPI